MIAVVFEARMTAEQAERLAELMREGRPTRPAEVLSAALLVEGGTAQLLAFWPDRGSFDRYIEAPAEVPRGTELMRKVGVEPEVRVVDVLELEVGVDGSRGVSPRAASLCVFFVAGGPLGLRGSRDDGRRDLRGTDEPRAGGAAGGADAGGAADEARGRRTAALLVDGDLVRLVAVWTDRETLDAYLAEAPVPRGTELMRKVGVEPELLVVDVLELG